MTGTKSLNLNWLTVEAAKKIVQEHTLPSEIIHKLMVFMTDELQLVAIRIHQPADRSDDSTQITHERLLNKTIPRRLNQVIIFPPQFCAYMRQQDNSYKIFDSQSVANPVSGEVNKHGVAIFLRHAVNGEFIGMLELAFEGETRYPSEKDIDVLMALKGLIFEQLMIYDRRRHARTDEDPGEVLDYLTGLHRYETFVENLDKAIPRLVDDNHGIIIVCSDINHFKLINENMGYRKGDELLRVSGQIISAIDHLIDACRFYSDNFIMAVLSTDPEYNRIRQTLERNNHQNALTLQKHCADTQICFNSGVYVIRNPQIDAASAISYANTARKQAKVFKGMHCVVFTEEMIEEMRRSQELNDELPSAIKNHNLMVYYQPKISCKDETIFGAEALIRWRREDGSFVYPDQFIPEFENNGNIIRLDYYVYDEVFQFIRNRLDNGVKVVPVSMNVSRRHLENEDILFYIEHLINKYDIPSEYIEFELTESIYIDNVDPALHFITRCNQMGIKVSMDDFGSGYSSLNMISSIPIDVLKIDGVFMRRGKELNKNDKIVLHNVINMAKELQMVVLCEGVETREQVDFLKEAGCDVIQGYFFGKPMPIDEFESFIEQFA